MKKAFSGLVFCCLALQAGSFNTNLVVKPPLPDVTRGAGTRFNDPAFGSRMVRVTDGNTMVGTDTSYRNRAFGLNSSSESNMWSVDGTRLLVVMSGGWALPYTFDGATMTATRIDSGTGLYGGRVIMDMGAEPVMSLSDRNLIYGNVGMSVRKMVWGVWTASDVKDFTGLVPDSTSLGAVSSGINERICTYGNQDAAHWVAWFDPAVGTAHVLNTGTSEIDGVPIGFSINKTVHNARIAKDGRYISISLSQGGMLIWDTQAGTVTQPLTFGGGHKVGGMGYFVNIDNMIGPYQFQALLRPMSDVRAITSLLPRGGAPYTSLQADMHPSWNNSASTAFRPVYMATYSEANPEPAQVFMGEIIAVYTDGSQMIERFAHHRSIYVSFNDSPRGNISPDGRFFAFTSNWGQTLGADRQDIFVVDVSRAPLSFPSAPTRR